MNYYKLHLRAEDRTILRALLPTACNLNHAHACDVIQEALAFTADNPTPAPMTTAGAAPDYGSDNVPTYINFPLTDYNQANLDAVVKALGLPAERASYKAAIRAALAFYKLSKKGEAWTLETF